MSEALGDGMRPAVVQQMAPPGIDTLITLHQQPTFGSAISLGMGGAAANTIDGVAVRVLPLTDADAWRLVESSRPGYLLTAEDIGPAALDRLIETLLRLACLAEAVPELAEARLNPVIVSPAETAITDVAARLAPWEPEPDPLVRRLT
jgi:ATP-grasp domain